MCGIAGALVFRDARFRLSEGYLLAMRESMIHRGPDGAGLWISKNQRVGLAHRRLSIIDLSEAAAQPMCTSDGALWITFNGEIYNHAEIRRELTELGHRDWCTDHSDTEVILHAFREWGIRCLERFNGMFAFALWDARSRTLWLARDRIGIKPLYYSVHNGRITFASEIKALLSDRDQERAVNERSLFHYLTFLTTPAPQTMFKGIRKVPSGTWIRVSECGDLEERRYWDALDGAKPVTGSEQEIAEQLQSEIRRAVRLRTVSDVPVGGFLSGGIDSSTTVAMLSEMSSSPVKSFTIGYKEQHSSYQNEMPHARRLARHVGADYHECLLGMEDVIDFLPDMVRLQDEPFADPTCIPYYFVSKLARDNGVVVCQAGEGADELFCGYPHWLRWIRYARLNDVVPEPLKRLGLAGLRFAGKQRSFYYERVRRMADGEPFSWSGNEMFTDADKRALLSARLRNELSETNSVEAILPTRRRFDAKAWERSQLNWMAYMDLELALPEWLLMRADKMSMGASVETRVPFLDHELVEFALGIPESLRTKNNTLKYILKRSVAGIVPDELISRRKQGLGVPVYEWLFRRLGDVVHEALDGLCRATDLFDESAVMNLFDDHDSRAIHRSRQCWTLFNFALWHREFVSDFRPIKIEPIDLRQKWREESALPLAGISGVE